MFLVTDVVAINSRANIIAERGDETKLIDAGDDIVGLSGLLLENKRVACMIGLNYSLQSRPLSRADSHVVDAQPPARKPKMPMSSQDADSIESRTGTCP